MPKLDCGDVALDYEVQGEGPALVFVHGAFADRRLWRPQLARFAPARRVVAYDLRGHGATGPSRQRRYGVALFADDLARLLDGLGIERAVLCGSSLGGMIAQLFASRAPERVTGLALVSSLADSSRRFPGLPPPWLLQNEILGLAIRLWGRKRFAAYVWRLAHAMQGVAGDPRAVEGSALALIEPEEFPKIYKAVYGFRAVPIPSLRAPVMVACGAREHEALKAQSRQLAALFGTPLVEIARAGHVASLEAPTAFNEALAGFLEQVATAAG